MQIDVVTIFPKMFQSPFESGVVAKALQKGLVQFHFHNLRDYTTDKHQTVDDVPFGGGGGLVFKVAPLVRALRDIKKAEMKSRSILVSPRGEPFSHDKAQALSEYDQLILFCGRYEGVDERFSDYVDEEISIGDYVLTGGEIPAMVLMDAVCRFIPGVVGQPQGPHQDSFSRLNETLLEHPHYTRPRCFEDKSVPGVLISGNHAGIEAWKRGARRNITLQRRPDLLKKAQLFEAVEDIHGRKIRDKQS